MRRVFRRIVEKVEQDLLHQHHIDLDHWQVGFKIDFDLMVLQDFGGSLNGRTNDVGEVDRSALRGQRARFEPRHVEEIADKPVEPLCLLLNGAQKACSDLVAKLPPVTEEARRRAENRSKRRAQIMRDRGEQGRAQAIRLRRETRAVDVSARD